MNLSPLSLALRRLAALAALAALLTLAACSTPGGDPAGTPAKEEIVAVSTANELLRFNAGQPHLLRERRPLQGLRPGEQLLGIDFRVARGELYALGAVGTAAQLYRIDIAQARAVPVGSGVTLPGAAPEWGFDFNPTVDRIRVVNSLGLNLRLHPDTGAQVDGDPATAGVQPDAPLAYATGDANAGLVPTVVAAGYTYNKADEKITTNYALDGRLGALVHQGSKEGVQPLVSPNSGRLFTVGSLGIGSFVHATLDISDLSNTAYTAVRNPGDAGSRWFRVDLATGKATLLGTVGGKAGGVQLVGAAIEP